MDVRFSHFFGLWAMQALTLFGAQLLSFALGVWVFVETGSLLQFGAIFAVQFLPGILFSPVHGVLIDRVSRHRVLVGALSIQLAALAVLWWFTRIGPPQLWEMASIMMVAATAATAQQLAFTASVPQLVPRERLGNANGLVQLSTHGAPIIAPILGALVFDAFGLGAVILVYLGLLGLAMLILLAVGLRSKAGWMLPVQKQRPNARAELGEAWRFITGRAGLLPLLVFMAVNAFSIGVVQILFRPMILLLSSSKVLGLLLSVSALAGVAGALLMTLWGGPKQRIHGVIGGMFVAGACMLLIGLSTNLIAIGAAAAAFSLAMPIVMASSQTIWQSSVPHDLQGRVLAFRQVISTSFLPLAIIASPLLVERVLDPMLANDGAFATAIAGWLGMGPGRSMALLFVMMGGVVMLIAIVATRQKALMQVESGRKPGCGEGPLLAQGD